MAPAHRFLLLEDDPVDVYLVTQALRDEGVEAEVQRAANREEFMRELAGGGFDLILSDYHLPGWDGFGALHEAQMRQPSIPFVFVTGTLGDEATVRAFEAGATDLVFKHQLWRLGPVVRRALTERAQRQALERAEQAVRASEERFRTLVEHSSDAIVLLDEQGSVQFLSRTAQAIHGYTPAERMGRSTFELVHPEDREHVRSMLARCRFAGPTRFELRIRHKDGRWIQIECMAADHLANPAIGALVLNYRDITERRRLEEMLRHAQKMEAIGRVAGGIAHDFNNLLGVTLGYSDLILRRMSEQEPLRPKVLEIRRAAERAAALTQQLMAFSRKRAPLAETLDLRPVIEQMAGMLERVLGEDVDLVLRVDAGAGRVRADRSQIEQVIMNLAVNARDAMPEGGKLIIECRNIDLDRPLELEGVAASGPHVLLSVSDTGQGMDAEVQRHVFEPFFTTKPPGEGTGLGLATVYGIVTQSGGHITLYSEPGRGTTFKVYLPRTEEAAEKRTEEARMMAVGGTETVLLVEDSRSLLELAREVLETAGYRVLEASTGTVALQLAAQHQGRIDLLLTDLVMPDITGRELAKVLREADPRLKVLFMSGYSDQAARHMGELAASASFIQKPFTADALLLALRDVLEGVGRT